MVPVKMITRPRYTTPSMTLFLISARDISRHVEYVALQLFLHIAARCALYVGTLGPVDAPSLPWRLAGATPTHHSTIKRGSLLT